MKRRKALSVTLGLAALLLMAVTGVFLSQTDWEQARWTGLLQKGDDLQMRTLDDAMTLEQKMKLLESLGIETPSRVRDYLTQNTSLTDASPDDIALWELLEMIGVGVWHSQPLGRTPLSSAVYSFDGEVMSLETMYSDFLLGVQGISGGELDLAGIEELTDRVNWEEGSGVQELRFTLNGHPYVFEGQVQYDWLDVRIIDFFNQALAKEGYEKRLYITPASQGYSVFWNTLDWAKDFHQATGLPISDSVRIASLFEQADE